MTNSFTGSFETSIAIRILGESATKRLIINYRYTPTWSYFVSKRRPDVDGTHKLDLGFTALAVPRGDRDRFDRRSSEDSYWAPLGQLLAVGVLKTALYARIQEKIDSLARQENRSRRELAGVPTLPPPEEI